MYQSSYAEMAEDDQATARRVEYLALDHVVALLRKAAVAPHPSREGIEALHATCQLWTTLIEALAAPENGLPDQLRANLISVGLWVLREADSIRLGRSTNYGGIADICSTIRDGLR